MSAAAPPGHVHTFPGTLSHVAVWSTPLSPTRVADHHVACMTGWAGERTDERIARVASWVGVTPAEMALDVGAVTVGHRDTSGASPVGVMQDLAVTEGGALLVDRSGRVQFDWRRHRTLQSSVLTVIGSDDNAVVSNADLRDVVNDVSVERSGGATVRKVDASSVQQFRRRRISVTTAADTDAQAIATAEYLLSRFAYPRPEIQSVSVDVHTLPSAQHAAILAVDLRRQDHDLEPADRILAIRDVCGLHRGVHGDARAGNVDNHLLPVVHHCLRH